MSRLLARILSLPTAARVWRYKVSRGTRVNIVANKPVEHAVVKLQISPEIIASESGFAQHFSHSGVRLDSVFSGRQEQCNIRIVGACQMIFHKHIGIRVVQADTLVVSDFRV